MSGAPVACKAASRSPVGKGIMRQGPPGRVIVMVPEPSGWGCRWPSRRVQPPYGRFGHIADSVRAEGAVRGTACFADPRPFCPVTWHPDCSPDWCMPRIPVGRFCAVLLAMDGWLVLYVPAAGAGFRIGPRHPIEAATEAVTECASLAGWKDWHGAVASDVARGSGRCASGGVMPQGFPGIPSQGLDLVEPVMHLSLTGDVPVVHPVGFQNSAIGLDLGFYAARSYSLMRPPRTGRRSASRLLIATGSPSTRCPPGERVGGSQRPGSRSGLPGR